MNRRTVIVTPALLAATLSVPLVLSGCQNSALKGTQLDGTAVDQRQTATIEQITALYEAGDHEPAYEAGRQVAWDTFRDDRFEGAYIAGLSAQALGLLSEAEKYLVLAKRSDEASLVVDASDALGLVYSQQERYNAAARELLFAGNELEDPERKARAYYYAGIAQQKLGQWSQARTTLVLARGTTRNPTFKSQIDNQVNVTGWTLQLGAYNQRDRAHNQAESVASKSRGMRLGLPRLVDGTTAAGEPVTFVHVGQFTSYQSATRFRDALGQPGVIIRALTP